jgi:hypothetical protein
MSRPKIEPGPPRWEASTLEKNHLNSLCIHGYSDPLQARIKKLNTCSFVVAPMLTVTADARSRVRADCAAASTVSTPPPDRVVSASAVLKRIDCTPLVISISSAIWSPRWPRTTAKLSSGHYKENTKGSSSIQHLSRFICSYNLIVNKTVKC